MQPDVLLMDEPFAALDALTHRKMQEELGRLREEARFTLLFVSHPIEEALVVGNRILLLSPPLGTYAGFQGVPETLRMAGRNYGLRGLPLVLQILVPAALPSILSGLKIGWAFAWRTLIAAELVFGVSSGKGGLGWYIFQNRNELYTDKVFAGLAAVILIGLLVENLAFRTLERLTIGRWGMQR